MSTLHDRIAALVDEVAGLAGTESTSTGVALGSVARRLRAVLAETATAQPEADAVERAARALHARFSEAYSGVTWDENGDAFRGYARAALAALAAAQPVERPDCCRGWVWVATGITEPETGIEEFIREPCEHIDTHPAQPVEPEVVPCDCASTGRIWCCMPTVHGQPVEPDPDEREAMHGVLSRTPLADGSRLGGQSRTNLVESLIAAGFRRSRPEATHTVTSAEVVSAKSSAVRIADVPSLAWCIAFLAALGVTVADTPPQAGGEA